MHRSRFPCRVCGQATESLDTYVICLDCAEEYELRSEGPAGGRPDPFSGAELPPTPAGVPLSDDEIRERIRHLLNDW